jgi:hypothetical protein
MLFNSHTFIYCFLPATKYNAVLASKTPDPILGLFGPTISALKWKSNEEGIGARVLDLYYADDTELEVLGSSLSGLSFDDGNSM